uniref:MER3 helicase-like winged helix domain-containing protein n=2 Tax=Salix viminalis TaxID=40686 RepID=A0A6N2MX66_SALVM
MQGYSQLMAIVPCLTFNLALENFILCSEHKGENIKQKMVNPAYYGLENAEVEMLNSYLSRLVQTTFEDVEDSGCIKIDGENVEPLVLGTIASQYYLSSMTISICFCISYLVLQKMMNFPCGITRKITMKHYQEEFDI